MNTLSEDMIVISSCSMLCELQKLEKLVLPDVGELDVGFHPLRRGNAYQGPEREKFVKYVRSPFKLFIFPKCLPHLKPWLFRFRICAGLLI